MLRVAEFWSQALGNTQINKSEQVLPILFNKVGNWLGKEAGLKERGREMEIKGTCFHRFLGATVIKV